MSTVTKALATDETALLIKQAIAQIPEAIRSNVDHNIPRKEPKDITSYVTDGSIYKRLNGTDGYSLCEDL